jgi:hypothetical protein
MKEETDCPLAERFSAWEKAYAQLSFWLIGVTGTVGIVLADWPWVLPYLVIYWYGVPGIIMRHLNCPRCPHLHVYGDCLQAPAGLTRWLIKARKTSPFSTAEKVLFYAIFGLIPTYPLFWLLSNRVLLGAFLIGVGAWYSGQFLYFCKRCRVYDCPFNRVSPRRWATTA